MNMIKDIKEYIETKYLFYNDNLSILDNLIQALSSENNGKTHYLIDSINNIQLKQFKICEIKIPNIEYYSHIEARKPLGKPLPIMGVVIKHRNKFILIDGYHRMKYAQESNVSIGDFIVLS